MLEVTTRNIRMWSMLGQRGTAFTMALPDIAENNKDVMVLTADLSLLSGLEHFKEKYPEQFLDVGIAEQNMIGIAAGLAKEGNCVFATTYATFVSMRCFEQIRNNLGVMNFNVKVIGSSAGVAMGTSGNCHHSIEDIAIMRAIPNLQVFSPADALETMKIIQTVSENNIPAYIRLTGNLNCPMVYREDYAFEIGKGLVLRQGGNIAFIATGVLVSEVLKAADCLQEDGMNPTVINIHTIKPLDEELIRAIAKSHSIIYTVEEHSIVGGLGSAVAEVVAEAGIATRVVRLGFKDQYSEMGTREYILQKHGLDADGIVESVMKTIS